MNGYLIVLFKGVVCKCRARTTSAFTQRAFHMVLDDSAGKSAVSHSRHICFVTRQTRLLCHTADMSAVSYSRHVCWVTQQTCLLCHTADMFAVRHSRHAHPCCDTKPRFCIAGGGGGLSPHSCDTKPRFCVAAEGGDMPKARSGHLPYARSSEMDRPQL